MSILEQMQAAAAQVAATQTEATRQRNETHLRAVTDQVVKLVAETGLPEPTFIDTVDYMACQSETVHSKWGPSERRLVLAAVTVYRYAWVDGIVLASLGQGQPRQVADRVPLVDVQNLAGNNPWEGGVQRSCAGCGGVTFAILAAFRSYGDPGTDMFAEGYRNWLGTNLHRAMTAPVRCGTCIAGQEACCPTCKQKLR